MTTVLLFTTLLAIICSCDPQGKQRPQQIINEAKENADQNKEESLTYEQYIYKLRNSVLIKIVGITFIEMPLSDLERVERSVDPIIFDRYHDKVNGVNIQFEILNRTEKTVRAIRWQSYLSNIYGDNISTLNTEFDSESLGIKTNDKATVNYQFHKHELGKAFENLQSIEFKDLGSNCRISTIVFSDGMIIE